MNHFTANSGHRYLGEIRRHRFDATNNRVYITGKGDRWIVNTSPSVTQLLRLTNPLKLAVNPRSIKSVKEFMVNLQPELLRTILRGNPEPFTIRSDGKSVSAINFRYRHQECDIFLVEPILLKWVSQDRFFDSFQDLKEAINDQVIL